MYGGCKNLARSWSDQLGLGVSLSDTFPEGTTRRRTITSFFDGQCREETIFCPNKKFEIEVFNVMLDLFVKEIPRRFVNQNKFKEDFGMLCRIMKASEVEKIKNTIDTDISAKCEKVAASVGNNIIDANDLIQEIQSFCFLPNKESFLNDLNGKEKVF